MRKVKTIMMVGGRRERMLKIVVFGIGRGGEAVARYLSTELETVEIIKVIDWSNPRSIYCDLTEMHQAARYFLAPYVGKVDLIVLADYTWSLAINSLRAEWPEQKIVGMEVDFRSVPKSCQNANIITLLANDLLIQSEIGREICRQLSYADVILPDCSGWENMIDMGEMSRDILEMELGESFVLAEKHDYEIPESRFLDEAPQRETNWRMEIAKFLLRAEAISRPKFALSGVSRSSEDNDYYFGYGNLPGPVEIQPEDEVWDPGVVYLLSPHFWVIKQDLKKVLGCGVAIVDFRGKLLHDVCLALKLRGVDGRLG